GAPPPRGGGGGGGGRGRARARRALVFRNRNAVNENGGGRRPSAERRARRLGPDGRRYRLLAPWVAALRIRGTAPKLAAKAATRSRPSPAWRRTTLPRIGCGVGTEARYWTRSPRRPSRTAAGDGTRRTRARCS